MDILFEEKDDLGKRDIFEKFLTYRRRMARLCAIQALYMYDIQEQINHKNTENNELFASTTPDLNTKVNNICHAVLYFYMAVFFVREEYGQNRKKKKVDEKYLHEVVFNTIQNINKVDELIQRHLNERWSLDRLDLVIKAILRCAVAEIICNIKTDIPILTSEYTNLASHFFSGKEIGFVNGIVDKISKVMRQPS